MHYYSRCVKYWCKLLYMSHDRLPYAIYEVLLRLDRAGYTTWVTHVKHILYRYGFGYVFISQDVGNIDVFMSILNERVRDCGKQEWHDMINNSDKLVTYCTFKSILEPEKYLSCVCIRKYFVALARFRCSNHSLEIEIGRDYVNTVQQLGVTL